MQSAEKPSNHNTSVLQTEPAADKMEEHLSTLQTYMRACESEGKYVEAEMAKKRIAELKWKDYENKKAELELKQAQQRQECEDAHTKQYAEFNQQWDQDLLQTQKEDAQALGELEDRHTKELQKNKEDLEAKLPLTFKFSAKLLNLQNIQASLAK